MPDQNQETKNAIIAIDSIKRMGIAESDSEIGKTIGYLKANLSGIRNAHRNMPLKYLIKLAESYHINLEFLTKNKLPVFDIKGPFNKYNNIADPSNNDINERLDRIEANQAKMMMLLLKLVDR